MSTMFEDTLRLRVRPGAVMIADEEGELARLAVGQRIMRAAGHGAVQVLRLLDGSRTLRELTAELAGEMDESDVAEAVRSLQLHGLVEPVAEGDGVGATGNGAHPSVEPTPQMRAFNDLGHDGAALSAALRRGRVAVVGAGSVAEVVATAVRRFGVGSVETILLEPPSDSDRGDTRLPEADLFVLAPDPFDPAYLSWFNQAALAQNRPWLPVYVAGFLVRLGPFVLPYETACWTCYERRVESNLLHYNDHRALRAALDAGGARIPPADNLVPGVVELAAGLAALETVRFLASRASLLEPILFGKTLEYAFLSLKGSFHSVLKLPRCPSCGARARGFPSVTPWMQPHAQLAST